MSSDLTPPPVPPNPTNQQWPAPDAPRWDPSFAPYGERQTPRDVPLSKAAITALVFGIIGGVLFAVIFGIVGLSATSNGTRRGRGFAWAGIVLAVVWVVGIVAVVVIAQGTKADRNLDGSVKKAGTSDVLSLQKGDCLQDPTADPTTAASAITNVDVVPCTQAHDAQVFDVLSVSPGDGSYDQPRIKAEVEQACTSAAKTALQAGSTFDLLYFYPQEDGWQGGGRTAVCMLSSPTPLTSSVVTG